MRETIPAIETGSARTSDFRRILVKISLGVIVAVVIADVFTLGMMLRSWTWTNSAPVRFHFDAENAFYWGQRVNLDYRTNGIGRPVGTWADFWKAYQRIYDTEAHQPTISTPGDPLDYPPMRLLVAALWVRQLLQSKTAYLGMQWSDLQPLMTINTICEFLTAAGAFALVRWWVIRPHGTNAGKSVRRKAWLCGALAAMLIWLNPAVIVDGHGWPQWDVWCAPFFVWAIYFASIDLWYLAGALIAAGAMFKGQMMLGAPVLFVWAIFSGRMRNILGVFLGFLVGAGLCTEIWLLPTRGAQIWLASWCVIGIGAGLPILIAKGWIKKPWIATYVLLILLIGLFGGCDLFGGSYSWFVVGFLEPTNRFKVMAYEASSIPQIMQQRWSWNFKDKLLDVSWPQLGLASGISMQLGTRMIYGVLLALSGFAAAIQARRNNPRALLGIIAPWILFYAVLAQMQERYLIWGAIFSAIGVAVSFDMIFLHLIITAIATADIVRKMLVMINPDYAPNLLRFLTGDSRGTQPEFGWVVLGVGLYYLFMAWNFQRREGNAIATIDSQT